MPESETHKNLVYQLTQWITKTFYQEANFFIWSDSPGTDHSKLPIRIAGFIPDVYAKSLNKKPYHIIGEAKSYDDLDTIHSEKQLLAFLRYCYNNEASLFLLAVPWDQVRYARSLLGYWKKLNQLEKVESIVLQPFIY